MQVFRLLYLYHLKLQKIEYIQSHSLYNFGQCDTKYYFYSIKWLDITGDAGHATPEEFDKFECAKMVTQAYVYRKTKKYLPIGVLLVYSELQLVLQP